MIYDLVHCSQLQVILVGGKFTYLDASQLNEMPPFLFGQCTFCKKVDEKLCLYGVIFCYIIFCFVCSLSFVSFFCEVVLPSLSGRKAPDMAYLIVVI